MLGYYSSGMFRVVISGCLLHKTKRLLCHFPLMANDTLTNLTKDVCSSMSMFVCAPRMCCVLCLRLGKAHASLVVAAKLEEEPWNWKSSIISSYRWFIGSQFVKTLKEHGRVSRLRKDTPGCCVCVCQYHHPISRRKTKVAGNPKIPHFATLASLGSVSRGGDGEAVLTSLRFSLGDPSRHLLPIDIRIHSSKPHLITILMRNALALLQMLTRSMGLLCSTEPQKHHSDLRTAVLQSILTSKKGILKHPGFFERTI